MTLSELRIPGARFIVAGAGLVTAIALLWLSRSYTFYFDEWDFIQAAPSWTWTSYLQPHNEHLTLIPHLVYSALLNTVGLRSYLPYMLVLVLLHAATALVLFELLRRRAGDAVALAAAFMLLVLGAGWEDLLWAFQVGFVGSVGFGLGALLLLDDPPSRRRIAAAAALLAASLMCSAIGAFFLAAALIRLAIPADRRRDLLWLLPVAVAFAVWYLTLGRSGTSNVPASDGTASLVVLPLYVLWGLAGGVGGVIGVTGAPALVVLLLAGVAVALDWRKRAPDPLALGVTGGLVSFYAVTGLARAQLGYGQAASGRYVYIGAALWLILLAGPARRIPWRRTWRPVLIACLFLACFNSSVLLVAYGVAKTQLMQREVADLQALAAQRSPTCRVPSGRVDRLVIPQVTNPTVYYRAVDRFGDPAAGRPLTDRADFDAARANLGCATP